MISETERAWLAGFLDADGMIRLRIGRKNKNKRFGVGPKSLVPLINYTNTCKMTGTRLAQLIGQSFTDFQATVTREKTGWNPKVTIEIGGIKRVYPFLSLLLPYLVTKATEARLALLFCEIRLANPRGAYTEREYQIFEALKYLKRSRHLRDYMPSVEEILDEDIVRTNAKALEVAEMTTRQSHESRQEWARNLVSTYRWKRAGHESNS